MVRATRGLLMAVLLLGSVAVAAAPASATDDGRCKDESSGLLHNTCNAATCPLFEGVFECLGFPEPTPPEVGTCDGANEVGATVDGSELCILVEDCPRDGVGVVVEGSHLCTHDPCRLFERPFRTMCENIR